MIKNIKIVLVISAILTTSIFWNIVNAADSTLPAIQKDFVPVSWNSTYNYNSGVVDSIYWNKNHLLYKVECAKTQILNSLWLTNTKIISVWLDSNGMDWNYDLKNCTMYWNSQTFNYSENKTLTKDEALNIAQKFYDDNIKNNTAYYQKVGSPIITYRNYGPIMYKADSMGSKPSVTDNIEIDDSNVTNVEKEYTNYSITFPFLIGTNEIYWNYGNPYWVTMEVYKSGVASVNVPLLKFKLVKKTSTLMTNEELKKFIDKWGNSPYYGNEKNINLNTIKNVLVISSIYLNNKTDMYLSTWIWLFSDSDSSYWSNEKYKQVISDYKVGNNAAY